MQSRYSLIENIDFTSMRVYEMGLVSDKAESREEESWTVRESRVGELRYRK